MHDEKGMGRRSTGRDVSVEHKRRTAVHSREVKWREKEEGREDVGKRTSVLDVWVHKRLDCVAAASARDVICF